MKRYSLEENLKEKAAAIKIFEWPSLGSELIKQTDITEKQYQELDKVHRFDIELIIWKYNKSNLVYNTVHSFYKYYDISKFNKLSIKSKCFFLSDFINHLNRFSSLNPWNENPKERKTRVHDTVSEWYNEFPDKYFDEYYDLLDVKKSWSLNLYLLI